MKLEILKLRQQQEDSQNELAAVEERIQYAECKQQLMISFVTKAARNPNIVSQLIRKNKQKRELEGGELGKIWRLLKTQETDCLLEDMDAGQSINCRNQVQQELVAMQSEITDILTEDMDASQQTLLPSTVDAKLCNPVLDQKVNAASGTDTPDTCSVNHLMWEKQLADKFIIGHEEDELQAASCKLFKDFTRV